MSRLSGQNVKLRRTGPGLDAIRKAHAALRKAILMRYATVKDAFNELDLDHSKTLRRSELRRFLRSLSKSIPDPVITALIDYVDDDGDGRSLTIEEFSKLMDTAHLE